MSESETQSNSGRNKISSRVSIGGVQFSDITMKEIV